MNIFPGSDGVVRDYPAALMIGGQIQPSIAVLLAEDSSMGDRSFQPDWSIDTGRIPRYSYVDVMKGRVPDTAIAGKRVLVGATAIELGDRYTVPRYGMVPGVVVQALAAESLLQGRAISRSGLLPTLAGIIAIAIVLGGLPYRRFHRSYVPCAVALLAIIGALPILIQAQMADFSRHGALVVCCAGLHCVAGPVLKFANAFVQASWPMPRPAFPIALPLRRRWLPLTRKRRPSPRQRSSGSKASAMP